MKNSYFLPVFCLTLLMSACAPDAAPTPTILLPTDTPPPATPLPTDILPTEEAPAQPLRLYENPTFGFSFAYPESWFGPDEYTVESTLRVAVGSDVVYPYGTGREEQVYQLSNSYYVVLQYTQNNQNTYWSDTYQTLASLQDGESSSGDRGMLIRVRQLELGPFKGFEYIATLSKTAQTEPFYTREVLLVDEPTGDLLTITGSPNNVTVGADWREAYHLVDEANLSLFHQIVESIIVRSR